MVFTEVQQKIRQVREAKGWDTIRLAQQTCLSERQIRQLEGEPGDSFYSDQIRILAAKKALARMGWDRDQLSRLFSSKHDDTEASSHDH